jgi:hypothetical protein
MIVGGVATIARSLWFCCTLVFLSCGHCFGTQDDDGYDVSHQTVERGVTGGSDVSGKRLMQKVVSEEPNQTKVKQSRFKRVVKCILLSFAIVAACNLGEWIWSLYKHHATVDVAIHRWNICVRTIESDLTSWYYMSLWPFEATSYYKHRPVGYWSFRRW